MSWLWRQDGTLTFDEAVGRMHGTAAFTALNSVEILSTDKTDFFLFSRTKAWFYKGPNLCISVSSCFRIMTVLIGLLVLEGTIPGGIIRSSAGYPSLLNLNTRLFQIKAANRLSS